jgi:hypothetical protein
MLRPTIDVDADVVVFPVQEKCVAIAAVGYMPSEMGYTVARGLGILIPRPGNYQFFNSHAATTQIYDVHDIGAFGQDPWTGVVMCGYDPLFPTRPQPILATGTGGVAVTSQGDKWRDGYNRSTAGRLWHTHAGTVAAPVEGVAARVAIDADMIMYRVAASGVRAKVLRALALDILNVAAMATLDVMVYADSIGRYDGAGGGVAVTPGRYDATLTPTVDFLARNSVNGNRIVCVAASDETLVYHRRYAGIIPQNIEINFKDAPRFGGLAINGCFMVSLVAAVAPLYLAHAIVAEE